MHDILSNIKASLDLKEVMQFYGVNFNKRGFANCPFHNEKTASLSIKNNRYKCFGCGASGSVIDFIMQLHGLNINQAARRLDVDFNLNLFKSNLSLREKKEAKDRVRCHKAILNAEKRINERYKRRHINNCELMQVIMQERLKKPENKVLKALEDKVEMWLNEDLEEWQVELWKM